MKYLILFLLAACTTNKTEPESQPPSSSSSASNPEEFESMVANSDCAKRSWKDRGHMPRGFVKGMVLTFGRSLCRQRAGQPVGVMLGKPGGNDPSRDVLSYYSPEFSKLGMTCETPEKAIRHTYLLGIGLGMRESSGKYCEGRDVSASNVSSDTAEAGPFQTSWNSSSSSPELKKLFVEYSAHPEKCLLDVFKEEVKPCKDTSNYGSGDGLAFQKLAKSCPAFAAEYAMVTLRTLRKHYGPINRKEAELTTSCNDILYEVEKSLTPEACKKLL